MLNDSINSILASISSTPLASFNTCLNMISLLDDKGFFDKPDDNVSMKEYIASHRVCDIYCKSGDLLAVCYFKFIKALSTKFKTPEELDYFIWRHLLYAICPSANIAYMLTKKFYGGNKLFESDASMFGHFYVSSMIGDNDVANHIPEELKGMKFDVVVGNPPYNGDIYLDFVGNGHKMAKEYSIWIIPSKWYAKSSSKNAEFRNEFMPSMDTIILYPDVTEVFGRIDEPSITVCLLDKVVHKDVNLVNKNNGISKEITTGIKDLVSLNIDYLQIVNKIGSCNSIYSNITSSLFGRLEICCEAGRGDTVAKSLTSEPRLNTDVRLMKGDKVQGYLPISLIIKNTDIAKNEYKVVVSQRRVGVGMLSPYILDKGDVCPKTYICIWHSTSLEECLSVKSYLETCLVSYLVTSSVVSTLKEAVTWKHVEKPDAFDHLFTDEELYRKYNFSDNEISVIESAVRGRR